MAQKNIQHQENIIRIVEEIQRGNNVDKNLLVLWENVSYMVNILARDTKGCELEDLKQEGFIALHDAVRNYDQSKRTKFSTYAFYWIKNRINRYICECTRGIKIQEKAEYTRRKYIKFISKYEMEYGKKPERGEICQFLKIDIEHLCKIEKIQKMALITSSDSPIDTEDANSISIIDMIAAPEEETGIIEKIDNDRIFSNVWKIVEKLPNQEKKVILYRYRRDMDQKEIANKMNISTKDVTKIHAKAISKLRNNHSIRELGKCYNDVAAAYYSHVGVKAYNTTWNSATEKAALRI